MGEYQRISVKMLFSDDVHIGLQIRNGIHHIVDIHNITRERGFHCRLEVKDLRH
jgi:hypothetical protein